MSAIATALSSGHSVQQILKYLSQHNPQLAKQISTALNAGHTVEHVLNYLSRHEKSMGKLIPERQERKAQNLYKTAQTEIHPNLMGAAKFGGALAATAGAGMALSRAVPQILQRGLGSNIPTGPNVPNLSPSPASPAGGALPANAVAQGTTQPITTATLPTAQQPPSSVAPTITNAPAQVQPEGISNISELIKKHGFEKQIEAVSKNVKDPKGVAAILYNKFPKEMQKLQKEAGKPMEEVVAEYMQSNVKPLDTEEVEPSKPMTREEALGKFRDKIIESHSAIEPLKKGETVASPQGIGEIREIRNGKAIVEVNGKKHQVNESQLEQEPEEIRSLDLEGPVEEYLSRIPEKQKSSVIDVSLFDPETNELQIRFPNGDQWIYGPVPEEIFEKINSMTGIPVSSGESKLRGTIWEKGVAESGGADFYKLIKKFVREGKIKERKLKTGIDLFRGFTSVKKRK